MPALAELPSSSVPTVCGASRVMVVAVVVEALITAPAPALLGTPAGYQLVGRFQLPPPAMFQVPLELLVLPALMTNTSAVPPEVFKARV